MNNEYIADIKFNGILEAEELNEDSIENLCAEIKILLKKYNITFNHYEFMSINKNKYSISKCEKCENLTCNRDKNPLGLGTDLECFFTNIYDGGIFDTQLFCEMCLPSGHRWGILERTQ